jgi:NAD(P)H-dependent FMN reductase
MNDRPLYIPVLLGTVRRGRMSAHAAQAVLERMRGFPGVETELIDIATLSLPVDDAGEAIRDPAFASRMERADALVIVTPEYNHGTPGLLKHVLDSCLEQYIHKAAGVVGVSAGPWGGTRAVESLLPVMRELGLVTIFWDVNFSRAHATFGADGALLDPTYGARIDKFLAELVWMARTLRHGREHVTLEERPA